MGGQRQYNLLHDDKRMWSSLSVSLASMGRGSRSVNSNGAAVGLMWAWMEVEVKGSLEAEDVSQSS